jgi:two-component system, cell cycle sensor histidine kinase and response regulator CckA
VASSYPLVTVTVLVVDDEPVARRIASRILSEEGYRVLEADGPEEALQVLGEARGRVDLVVLDVVLRGGADGVALTMDIHAEWPDQRLLYMSAHPAEVLARHGLKDLNVPFLAKPYTRAELLAKVWAALRRRADIDPGTKGPLVERRKNRRFKGK